MYYIQTIHYLATCSSVSKTSVPKFAFFLPSLMVCRKPAARSWIPTLIKDVFKLNYLLMSELTGTTNILYYD